MRWNMGQRLYTVVGGMLLLACVMAFTGIMAASSVKDDGDSVIAAGHDETQATSIHGMIHDSGADMEMMVVGIERKDAAVVRENIDEVNGQIEETIALGGGRGADAAFRQHARFPEPAGNGLCRHGLRGLPRGALGMVSGW